jgi:hypothetical protein
MTAAARCRAPSRIAALDLEEQGLEEVRPLTRARQQNLDGRHGRGERARPLGHVFRRERDAARSVTCGSKRGSFRRAISAMTASRANARGSGSSQSACPCPTVLA